MVLTITLNPLLERRITYPKINYGKENKNGTIVLKAGGKGINVSRQLLNLGLNTIALSFSGGTNGKLFRDILRNEKINYINIHTNAETRSADVIIDSSTNSITTFFTNNSEINKEEKNLFLSKMEKMIANCEIVVFSGSSPCKETDSIFPTGIEIANMADKISICDTYGTHLNDCLESSPTIVHNNIYEIESSVNLQLKSEKDKIEFLNQLFSKGIKQSFITDGEKPIYAANFDFHYKVNIPKITPVDPTGSGDAFTAGVAYGWHSKITFKDQLALATAIGICNAGSMDTCEVSKDEALKLSKEIEIIPVGKKTKIIDDTPN